MEGLLSNMAVDSASIKIMFGENPFRQHGIDSLSTTDDDDDPPAVIVEQPPICLST